MDISTREIRVINVHDIKCRQGGYVGKSVFLLSRLDESSTRMSDLVESPKVSYLAYPNLFGTERNIFTHVH